MSRVSALIAHLQALTGWRRRFTLLLAGALAALALPPLHVLPVLLLCFPVLVWIWDASPSRKAAFGAGWWFSAGWFSAGLYWISHALLTDPVKFGWMIPFAIFGLSGLLAAFVGLATLAVHLSQVRGTGRVLLLAVAWTVSEWLRSWVMTGFPWNPLGSVWDISLAVSQFGAFGGIWGLSLLTAVMVMAPAVLPENGGVRRVLALSLGLPLALALGGSLRMAQTPVDSFVPGIKLRLVQAAVAQSNKWRDDLREANLREHVRLSRSEGFESITTVVWPETAISYVLDLDLVHREAAAAAAPLNGMLLTGVPRMTPRGVEPFQVWNSLMAVTAEAQVAAVYDKSHLVPFGEYVPLRAVLPIAKITHGGTDFSAGPGPQTLTVAGLPPFSTMICYEAIFPHAVVAPGQPRPHWLLNITNDGWFGISSGPYQHLAASRMRAIEEGLPLVRAANTGISVVLDPYGREIARLGLGERGIVDSPLPRAVAATPYGSWGNLIPATMGLLLVLAVFLGRRLTLDPAIHT